MTRIRVRRGHEAALLLVAALLFAGLSAAVTLGVEENPAPDAASSPVPGASTEPSPEPTLFPTFDPSTVRLRLDLFVGEGLEDPVYLTDDGTGSKCVYVVERGGTVKIVDVADGFVRPRTFLDISKLVRVGAEQGLHSIAFHPGFRKNGRFFVHYNDLKGDSVIAEFRGTPCKPASNKPVKKSVLTEVQPFPNNNGGWIGFGPDGYLYIALGDGGGISPGDPRGYGQAKSSRLSKILRIDVDAGRLYAIPRSNPFPKKGKTKGYPREMWAMGLRDPRRASFDRKSGDLWIGDVGQDSFEEVDRIPAGAVKRGSVINFGWSDMEGDQCHNLPDCDPSLYEPPAYFYDQAPPHDGIVGGYVYRGAAIPKLRGVYLFSDQKSGFVWGLDAEAVAAGVPVTAQVLLDAPQGFVSFGEDDAGELYLVALDGSVYRIEAEDA